MRACLPACVRGGVKIIANFGAANAPAAAALVGDIARELGFPDINIATVTGDDVRHLLEADMEIWEFGGTVADLEGEVIAANAYLGIEPIVEALEAGADIVITGRVADPSLFVAPPGVRIWLGPGRLAADWSSQRGGSPARVLCVRHRW